MSSTSLLSAEPPLALESSPEAWIRMDGHAVGRDAAVVSVFDHGLLYGDGAMESLRFANRRPFELHAHLDRLAATAHVMQLTLPCSLDAVGEEVRAVIADSGRADGYIRLMVTRGAGGLGMAPAACGRPRLILICSPVQVYDAARANGGISAITFAARQRSVDGFSPRLKSLNYLANILAHLDAQAAGADEGIFLTPEGFVSEGTAENVFVVRAGRLMEPDPACGGIDGITAAAVRRLAERDGIPCETAWLTRYDLYTADELFLTGTAAGIAPVAELDGRRIGSAAPGPMTQRLEALLNAAMQRGAVE